MYMDVSGDLERSEELGVSEFQAHSWDSYTRPMSPLSEDQEKPLS